MADSIRTALERWATLRVALAALAGVAACVAGLLWRQDRPDSLPLLDSRTSYTPADAAAPFEALDRLDANARAVYAATGLTIDMVFPAACGLLFANLPVRLFRGRGRRSSCCRSRQQLRTCWRTRPSPCWRWTTSASAGCGCSGADRPGRALWRERSRTRGETGTDGDPANDGPGRHDSLQPPPATQLRTVPWPDAARSRPELSGRTPPASHRARRQYRQAAETRQPNRRRRPHRGRNRRRRSRRPAARAAEPSRSRPGAPSPRRARPRPFRPA